MLASLQRVGAVLRDEAAVVWAELRARDRDPSAMLACDRTERAQLRPPGDARSRGASPRRTVLGSGPAQPPGRSDRPVGSDQPGNRTTCGGKQATPASSPGSTHFQVLRNSAL
jgi:hypothetical protein